MKRLQHILAIPVVVVASSCLAADDSYYRDFLAASKGKPPPFQVMSANLVDTNNCSPTVRQRPFSVAPGMLGGLRLGMSMDDVVSVWGKPLGIGCCISNRPSFAFEDAHVRFDGNQVAEVGLYVARPWTPQFSGGLVPISPRAEWTRFLGQPSGQITNASAVSVWYETNNTVTTLRFGLDDKWLSSVSLSRPRSAQIPTQTQ
jgi:hypothetical protein